MSYPPPLLVGTYDDARAALEGREINECPNFSRMGAESMTKTCYKNELFNGWVYLVSANERILLAEVTQLRRYGEHMRTPYLGPKETEKLVFKLTRRGETVFAFLEMKFSPGYKEVKVKSDQDGSWIYNQVLTNLKTTQQLTMLLEFLTAADNFLKNATEDIPDFQVAWDPGYGMMFMFDPGDPENWGSALDSHKKAIARWMREATNNRLAKQIQKREEGGGSGSEAGPSSPPTTTLARTVTPPPKISVSKPVIEAVRPLTPVAKVEVLATAVETRVVPADDYMCHDCNVVFTGLTKLRIHRLNAHGAN